MHDEGDEFGDVYDNRRIFYSVHTEAQWTQREDGTASCPGESIELEIFCQYLDIFGKYLAILSKYLAIFANIPGPHS